MWPPNSTDLNPVDYVVWGDFDISQGSVATHLRCGGIFSDSIITNFLLDPDSEIILTSSSAIAERPRCRVG